MMFPCFLCCDFSFHKKLKFFIHYVLHLSQSMTIGVAYRKFFSGEVEVISCSYIAGMLLCCAEWRNVPVCVV